MLPSFLLALREGVEAALILGIVLSTLRTLQRADLNRSVWAGASAAGLASLGVATGLRLVGATLEEPAEQIFEGISMLLAAGILTWMLFWVKHQARHQRVGIEEQVRGSLAGRPIFWLAFLAVFREGVELALFLLAVGSNSAPLQTLTGALLGLAAAALLGWLAFNSSRRLSMRAFFQATNILLLLVAAGLVAHGIHEFVEIGWLPTLIDPLYDVNGILNENSILGSLLKAMFGYNGNPSLLETLVYAGYLAALGLLVSLQSRPARLQSTS